MRDLCHMRGLECACPAGRCQQQAKAIPAPTVHPTNRDMLVVFVTCIVIAVIIGGTVQALQVAEREYQLQLRIG